MFEDVLKPALFEQTQDLIDEARRAGCRIVLVTGALDFTMRPLARYLGADDIIANKMQFVGGMATGKVIPPIIEGANKANAIRDYCVKRGPGARPVPRLLRQRLRLRHARGGRAAHRGQPGHAAALARPRLQLAHPRPQVASLRPPMRPLKTLQKLYDEESHVVITEKGSPPRVLFYGEDFLLEDLPVGTRVIFPRPPLEGVPNVKAAIRWAINHPEGMDPLHALLKPGHEGHLRIDDISLPLPPMVTPDVRQTILEIVLELLRRLAAWTTSTSSSPTRSTAA